MFPVTEHVFRDLSDPMFIKYMDPDLRPCQISDRIYYQRDILPLVYLCTRPALLENRMNNYFKRRVDVESYSDHIKTYSYCFHRQYATPEFMLKTGEASMPMSRIRTNNLYCYNLGLVGLYYYNFLYDFTKEKSQGSENPDEAIIRIPVLPMEAIRDYVYSLVNMFEIVRVYKGSNDCWFKDSFNIHVSGPSKSRMIAFRDKLVGALHKKPASDSNKLEFDRRVLDQPYNRIFKSNLFDNAMIGSVPDIFQAQWDTWMRKVQLGIYTFHQNLRLSIKSVNVINPYQDLICNDKQATERNPAIYRDNLSNKYPDAEFHPGRYKASTWINLKSSTKGVRSLFSELTDRLKYNSNLKFTNKFPTGQLKLMMTLIRFLLRIQPLIGSSEILIIYIGSAPGNNIYEIIKVFHRSNITWLLVDPRQHDPKLDNLKFQKAHNVRLAQCYWIPEILDELSYIADGKEIGVQTIGQLMSEFPLRVLFSDIRTEEIGKGPTNKTLDNDYLVELKTVRLLAPIATCLKERFKFDPEASEEYIRFKGELWLQNFTAADSAELRCYFEHPIEYKVTQEDCKIAEEKMFHFNVMVRVQTKNDQLLGNMILQSLDRFDSTAVAKLSEFLG